ncbi:unnamed protein product [Adineta ricciae]|uniref:Uncharacterized protein n=1 Tax=Adineta ricciae TaxID=249248 RepID=A0A814M3J6_ADIRI|nr:unnamed protein product [Adineta ricciae]
MAGTYDTEEQRIIDRIRCIAFQKIHRSVRSITDWWQKPYDQCFTDYSNADPKLKFSQAGPDIILEASGRQRESCSVVAKEIAEKRKEYVVPRTVNNYRHREEDECYREIVKNQACIRIFVIFTAKKLHWVIKDKGESWTGQYFRDKILTENVIPFLKNKKNVIDPDEVILIHGKTPCMRVYPTQHLLQENDIWPGNSLDLNVAEHVGSIIKDEVETKMLSETRDSRYLEETLKMHLSHVLADMETNTDLFETLLCSYPSRLRAVKSANGRHIDY